MSSTTTPSDDKLYMTEDLEGRLDPESLTDKPFLCPHYPGQSVLQRSCIQCASIQSLGKVEHMDGIEPEDFYQENNLVFPLPAPPEPEFVKASVMLVFESAEGVVLEGNLTAASFGHEGWLCTISVEQALVPPVVLQAAKEKILHAQVVLPDGSFQMHTNIDCTATFSGYGGASFTVTSDEARYV